MDGLLHFRQAVKNFYARNDIYMLPVIKFLMMMGILLLMNWHLGYRYVQMRWILVILVSLMSCLLPWSGITAVAACYLLGHVSALSWEAALVLLILMFAAVVLHFFFLPGGSILILLMPIAFYLRIPFLIPLLAGIYGSALAFLPVGIGTIFYYTLAGMEENASILLDPGNSIPASFQTALAGLLHNHEMVLVVAVFMAVTLLVYGVNHLSMDYARIIAVAGGGLLMILGILLGSIGLKIAYANASFFIVCVVCTLLALLITLWSVSLDYNHAETFMYEDDEYEYYVKAVPKIIVEGGRRQVRGMNRDEEDED